jgi:hypothetical protein
MEIFFWMSVFAIFDSFQSVRWFSIASAARPPLSAGAALWLRLRPRRALVGQAVLCPPPPANPRVLFYHDGAHGVTRPTRRTPGQSARGLAHSKTLRAFKRQRSARQRFGLRRPSAAFPRNACHAHALDFIAPAARPPLSVVLHCAFAAVPAAPPFQVKLKLRLQSRHTQNSLNL